MSRTGRSVSGVLVLNKDAGLTSNAALQQVRRLYFAARAGHTGSLDPVATGVLVVCFGLATKFAGYLIDADKRYDCTFVFGAITTTGDGDGELIASPGADWLTVDRLQQVLTQFVGKISQVPPMYSAVKIGGKPLYKLARQGVEVHRDPREVTVYSLELQNFRSGPLAQADLSIHCSKGTYIRTLAEDIGKVLGCGAHSGRLCRTGVGEYTLQQAVTFESLCEMKKRGALAAMDELLLPTESLVSSLLQLEVTAADARRLRQGQIISPSGSAAETSGMVSLTTVGDGFIGLGEIRPGGILRPCKLLPG